MASCYNRIVLRYSKVGRMESNKGKGLLLCLRRPVTAAFPRSRSLAQHMECDQSAYFVPEHSHYRTLRASNLDGLSNQPSNEL